MKTAQLSSYVHVGLRVSLTEHSWTFFQKQKLASKGSPKSLKCIQLADISISAIQWSEFPLPWQSPKPSENRFWRIGEHFWERLWQCEEWGQPKQKLLLVVPT